MPYLLVGLTIVAVYLWWSRRPSVFLQIQPGSVVLTPASGQIFQATLPAGAQFQQSVMDGGAAVAPWGGFAVLGSDSSSTTFSYSSGGGAVQIQWVDQTGTSQQTTYSAATS